MPPCKYRFCFRGKISDRALKALSDEDKVRRLLRDRDIPWPEVTKGIGGVFYISYIDEEAPCGCGGRITIRIDSYSRRWVCEYPSADRECPLRLLTDEEKFAIFQERVRRTTQKILTLLRNFDVVGKATSDPKGTDVVLPATTMESDRIHGGEHASGEVPDSNQASPEGRQEARKNGTSGHGSHCQQATCEPNQKPVPGSSSSCLHELSEQPEDRRMELNAGQENASSRARTSEEEATREDALENLQEPRESSTVPVPGDPQEAGSEKIGLKNNFRSLARLSRTPCKTIGAQLCNLSHQSEKRLVRQMEKIMAQVRLDNELDFGPRIDKRKMSCKVAGYLRPVTLQDNKIEEGRPALLVLPDVSGSMGRFTYSVTKAGMALGKTGRHGWDVIVVSHSNGFPCEISINGKPVECAPGFNEENEALEWYKGLINKYNLKLVIACADWDGAWLYKYLTSLDNVVKLIWLDPYCCSRTEPKLVALPEPESELFNKSEKQKIIYSIACGSVEQVTSALQQAVKKI